MHASLQDLGEPFDSFGERWGVERGDLYGLLFHDLTGELAWRLQRGPFAGSHQLGACSTCGKYSLK
jgi:hypothetical protein